MNALTWRTIRRGEKWRDKTGRYVIVRRPIQKGYDGEYHLLIPHHPYSERGSLSSVMFGFGGCFATLNEAKDKAALRADSEANAR